MKKVNNQSKKWALCKKAFDEIIGDPYALDPNDGHYMLLKTRSNMAIAEPEIKSHSPVNKARPNAVDFFCDVEAAVKDGLEVAQEKGGYELPLKKLLQIFDNTYYLGSGEIFSQIDRSKLEQVIGNIFVKRGLYPVSKYFTTIKQ